jgi:PleD family two-component response regulator
MTVTKSDMPTKDLQVLVAEDEALVRLMVADVLREQGFHVFEAVDAEEAVAILKAVPVDASSPICRCAPLETGRRLPTTFALTAQACR